MWPARLRHTLLDTEGHRKVKQKKAYVLGLIVKNSTGSCDISTRAIIIGSLAYPPLSAFARLNYR